MTLWKVSKDGPSRVTKTKFKQEKILEKELENWIANDPSILGEKLLIIGRQVIIPEVKDRLDLLALDPQGNTVIIELKRGSLKDPVDIQSLRYASYLSKWKFDDFENIAKNFLGESGNSDFNFNSVFEDFCDEAGVGDSPDINEDQRLIIVGSEVKDRLGSVALWLRDHSVDIKIVEVTSYKDGDSVYIEPRVIVPIPVSKFESVGKTSASGPSPWLKNGRTWHLEKRCSNATKEMLLKLIRLIDENFQVDGPNWNQKLYVSFRINNITWLNVRTFTSQLELRFLVKSKQYDINDIANELGVVKFDSEVSFSEKLNLPSSVTILEISESSDRIVLRLKKDFDLESSKFIEFCKKVYKAFPK